MEEAGAPLHSSAPLKLHGGPTVNGRPSELVFTRKDGQAVSMVTKQPVDLDEDAKDTVRVKRSASEELQDEEEIMRSMARRKKNAPPEMYAPKKCPEPGCNKKFPRPCDLTKHEKTHSRPWKCPDSSCGYYKKGWPTEKERDRHINDKHSENPPMYECQDPTCSYKSKRETNCKQHKEKSHGWTYVRTKNNGKRDFSKTKSTALATPQLQNMSTPVSDFSVGAATPPQDHFLHPGQDSLVFPTYQDEFPVELPQRIEIDYEFSPIDNDYSPIDNGTPSTDSGLDHPSAYLNNGQDFTLFNDDDVYAAMAQVPSVSPDAYAKAMVYDFMDFSNAQMYQAQPSARHISPTGHGNTMLFSPNSLADVDEGFEDYMISGVNHGRDFTLFPDKDAAKAPAFSGLFGEIPSVAAGYSQPNSQNIPLMEWQLTEYGAYEHH